MPFPLPFDRTLLHWYSAQMVVFLLVLMRLSGLVMAAPVVGSRAVPVRIRVLLVLTLTLLVAPTQWGSPAGDISNLVQLLIVVAQEVLIGLAVGLGVTVLLAGLQLAGHIASQMSGMALADVFDPGVDTSVPVFSRAVDLTAMMVFIAIGGHRTVLEALLDTFRWMPPGRGHISGTLVDSLGEIVAQSFVLGVRAASPVVLALLMSMLVMGLVSRTLPQLNVFAIGFSLNSIVMLTTMAVSLGAIAWMVQDEIQPTLAMIGRMFASAPANAGGP